MTQAFNAEYRYIVPKVEVYFNGASNPPITFTDADVVTFSLLEEVGSESENVLGSITSNQFTFSLININNAMNPANAQGTYYGKFTPGVKVKPYITIQVDGVMTDVPVGTFWTGDWTCPTSGMEVGSTCYDRLYSISKKPQQTIQVLQNTSVQAMFAIVFTLAGLSSSEYEIDTSLNVPLSIGWLPTGTIGDSLKLLAEAGQCYVFVDRNNKIQVRKISVSGSSVATFTDNDQIVSIDTPFDYINTYSKIIVDYAIPYLDKSEQLLNLQDISFTNGVPYGPVSLSKGPMAILEYANLIGAAALKPSVLRNTAWEITLTPDATAVATLDVYGRVLQVSKRQYTWQDNDYLALIGEHILSVSNNLIQSAAYAQSYAESLADLVGHADTKIAIEIRGTTAVKIGDIVTVNSTSQKVSNKTILIQRITLELSGGLSGSVEGINIA